MSHRGPRPKHSTRVGGARPSGPTLRWYPRNAGRPKPIRQKHKMRHPLPPGPRNIAGTLWNGWTHKQGPRDCSHGVTFPWSIPAVTDGCRRVVAEQAAAAAKAVARA